MTNEDGQPSAVDARPDASETERHAGLSAALRLPPRRLAPLVVLLGAVWGGLWIVLIPPLQTPDERNHLCRIWMLSEGRWRGVKVPGRDPGAYGDKLPASLDDLSRRLGTARMRFHAEVKLDPADYMGAFDIPTRSDERRYYVFTNTLHYPPTAYLPQLCGMWVGRLLNLPLVLTIYLIRALTLAVALALIYFALRQGPPWAYGLFLLVLMPMTMQQLLCPGGDAMLISASLLFLTRIWRLRREPDAGPFPWRDIALLGGLGLIVATAKLVYVPLCFAFLLIPTARFGSARRRAVIAAGVLAALAVASAGSVLAPRVHGVFEGGGLSPAAVKGIIHHPFRLVHAVVRNLGIGFTRGWTYHSAYGILGWFDTPVPWVFGLLHGLALFVGLKPRGPDDSGIPSAWAGVMLMVAGLACLPLINAAVLVKMNREAYLIQGRYYLPLIPPLGMAAHLLLARWRRLAQARWHVPGLLYPVVAGLSFAGATVAVVSRYYLEL